MTSPAVQLVEKVLCSLCPENMRIHLVIRHAGYWLYDTFSSLNDGIEFSPIVACWIFIIAAINWVFPSILPSYFNWKKLSTYFRILRRAVTIWLMYYFIWVPANRALFWTLKEYLTLPVAMYQQWLPFLSLVLSIYILALSMSNSGLLHAVKYRRKIAWDPVVRTTPLSSPRASRRSLGSLTPKRTPPQLRTTRSGTVYGTWDM